MARYLAAFVIVAATGSAVQAQEAAYSEPKVDFAGAGLVEPDAKLLRTEFGLRAGYIKPRDADDGTWFGGIQLRVPLTSVLAVEGSIELHTSEFADGEIEVIQYPVQASLLVFLLPESPTICPYVLGGLGWYYTTIDFSGSLSGIDSETDSMVGAHLGFGARIGLGGAATLNADLRYIFLEPDEDALQDEDFDTIQLVLSLSFPF